VRNAVMELDDVEPREQEAILREFFGHAPPREEGGVELEMSAASQQLAMTAPTSSSKSEPAERFRFLHDASSEQLARRLRDEHPQLLALVVAHLPAEKAAEFLEYLSPELQEDVLDRLGDLDEADTEVVGELERELERMFAGAIRPRVRDARRQDHVQAILGHLRRKSVQQTVAARPELPEASPPAESVSLSRPQLQAPATPVVAMAFEQLISLAAADFYAVFEEADPRIVMLALAGAPRRLFERYLAQFSTDRALEFERHLEQLRPLRLRDVEMAQQELATLAGRRLQVAKTAAESSRRFAAAA
jgi:flagellar motor switch protein FliG